MVQKLLHFVPSARLPPRTGLRTLRRRPCAFDTLQLTPAVVGCEASDPSEFSIQRIDSLAGSVYMHVHVLHVFKAV